MASIELLIAIFPFLVLYLGVVQLALASAAKVAVQHAAFTAARAAVVWIPRESGAGAGGDVRAAAALPMVPLSPAVDSGPLAVSDYLSNGNPERAFAAKAAYARAATAVVWTPKAPRWNDEITVEVGHLFACQVPIAKQIVCKKVDEIDAAWRGRFSGTFPGRYLLVRGRHTLTNQGRP